MAPSRASRAPAAHRPADRSTPDRPATPPAVSPPPASPLAQERTMGNEPKHSQSRRKFMATGAAAAGALTAAPLVKTAEAQEPARRTERKRPTGSSWPTWPETTTSPRTWSWASRRPRPGICGSTVQVYALFDPSALGIPTQRYALISREAAGGHRPESNRRRCGTRRRSRGPLVYPASRPSAGTSTSKTTPWSHRRCSTRPTPAIPTPSPVSCRWTLEDSKFFVKKASPECQEEVVIPPPEAQHYMLILSGHGSGSTEDFLLRDEANRGLAHHPRVRGTRWLRPSSGVRSSRSAMTRRRERLPLDLLGMDACFMSMLEVCYSVQFATKFLVGAEGYEPALGWPYQRILDHALHLRKQHQQAVSPEPLAQVIVQQYVNFYADHERTSDRSVDLAAIKLNGVGEARVLPRRARGCPHQSVGHPALQRRDHPGPLESADIQV